MTEIERLAQIAFDADEGDAEGPPSIIYQQIVRAILRAMREPSADALRAGCAAANAEQVRPTDIRITDAQAVLHGVIDHILSEGA